MTLLPRLEGRAVIRAPGEAFLAAFRRRVESGLLAGRPAPRSNYAVVDAGAGHLSVHALDWWTAIAVGLNDLELRHGDAGAVNYRVRFWRWAVYAIGLSAALGLIGVAMLLAFDVRAYVARHPSRMIPGLSIDQNVLVAWAMVLFWGFVWPWVLIALHKLNVHRLVRRLIAEVDAAAART